MQNTKAKKETTLCARKLASLQKQKYKRMQTSNETL